MSVTVRDLGGAPPPHFHPGPSLPAVPPRAPSDLDRRRELALEYLTLPDTIKRLAGIALRNLAVIATGPPRVDEESAAGLSFVVPYLGERWTAILRERKLRDEAQEKHEATDREAEDKKVEWRWCSPDGRAGEKRDDTPEEARLRAARHAAIEADLLGKLDAPPRWRFNESAFQSRIYRDGHWRDLASGAQIDGEELRVRVLLAPDADTLSVEWLEQVHALRLGEAFERWMAECCPAAPAAEEL